MTATDYITIIAIILGPILAVQAEKFLERKKDKKNKRVAVFKTLMATRGTVLSTAHVEALNRIDLEFSDDKKYNKVIASWKEYFDNLSQKVEQDQLSIWSTKNEELLANLLFEMGISLGYNFDKVLIKRNIYSPVGHGKIERENEMIRKNLLDLLQGESNLPVAITSVEIALDSIEKQDKLYDIMSEYYKRELEKNP